MPALLSLLGMLAVMLLILAGAYGATRWAGRGFGGAFTGGRLRVLDRARVGREQQVLVVQAGERYFLLGSSPAQVSLLAELSREEGELWHSPPPNAGRQGDFRTLLKGLRNQNRDGKG